MKNSFLLFILFTFINLTTFSQSIAITPQIGYNFSSTYYDGYNHIRFNESIVYGGSFFVSFKNLAEAGVNIMNQETTADASNYVSDTTGVKVGICSFHLIGNYAMDPLGTEKLLPYAGLGIGGSYFYVKNGHQNRFKVSVTIQAGTRFQITNKLGVRLQGNLLIPISSIGLGIGVGNGGVSVGTNANSSMLQFGLTAGVYYKFGNY
jgi:opacity protein-like surface antigen